MINVYDVQLCVNRYRDSLDTVLHHSAANQPAAAAAAVQEALTAVSRRAARAVLPSLPGPTRRQPAESPGRRCASHSRCCRQSTRCAARWCQPVTTATISSSNQQLPSSSNRSPWQPTPKRGVSCENEATRRQPTSHFTSGLRLPPRDRGKRLSRGMRTDDGGWRLS